ncbi:MAG TPA: hydrolase [Myxococcales bacterium]|nr:hydrolase [Deltaproteobacteria bacterium]MBU47275.1 hydrolase [Deltaproteobacteria bacterium]HAA58188.1 hydrolase [Myxococcales bacterium]
MSRHFLMACVQLCSINDLRDNLKRCRHWIREAAKREVELVMLPEDFAFLAEEEDEKKGLPDADFQLIIETIREEAIRHGIHILAGGYPVRVEGSEKLYNRATLFSPKGEEIAHYNKIHLFDADPPGAPPLRESDVIAGGDEVVVAQTSLCDIGMSICYDLRFPELYRHMALQGADLLTVPAAFTLTTGKDHWEVLLRARAIENQCYLAAPAQWGKHSHKRHSFGRAMIIDPWGTVLACAPEGEGLAIAEFSPKRIEEVRGIVPCRQHIQPSLFSPKQ